MTTSLEHGNFLSTQSQEAALPSYGTLQIQSYTGNEHKKIYKGLWNGTAAAEALVKPFLLADIAAGAMHHRNGSRLCLTYEQRMPTGLMGRSGVAAALRAGAGPLALALADPIAAAAVAVREGPRLLRWPDQIHSAFTSCLNPV